MVPNDSVLCIKIVLEAHEPPFVGYFGIRRTAELVARNWRWETMKQDVEKIVATCDLCQRSKIRSKKDEAPIELMVADAPWEMVTVDFLSGFVPSSPGKFEGCIVVCDRFSRMMHVKECSTHPSAKEAARLFIQLVVRAHGVPRFVLTDRGAQFESTL